MNQEGFNSRRIAVVTSSRADYGHLYWPLRELKETPGVSVRLIVTGAQLSPEFGSAVREIERDGFPIAERVECLLSSDTDVAMGKTIGLATISFTDALARMRPDLLLLIADRYEMLAPAMAALTLRIPVAHIEGGELSEGAIDQQVRNALTMLSHLHLVTTESARMRLLRMGEEAWRIHRVGAGSLDHLHRTAALGRPVLERRLGVPLAPPLVIVGLHPVTIEQTTTSEAEAVFTALERHSGATILFCFPNADAGSRWIADRARGFCQERETAHVFVNNDRETHWGLLRIADLILGNSSSGIMESPSLGLPAINVGIRQQGRERASNVVDVAADPDAIVRAMARVLAPGFRESMETVESPYGDGRAAGRIVRVLTEVPLDGRLLEKHGLPDGADAAHREAFS